MFLLFCLVFTFFVRHAISETKFSIDYQIYCELIHGYEYVRCVCVSYCGFSPPNESTKQICMVFGFIYLLTLLCILHLTKKVSVIASASIQKMALKRSKAYSVSTSVFRSGKRTHALEKQKHLANW